MYRTREVPRDCAVPWPVAVSAPAWPVHDLGKVLRKAQRGDEKCHRSSAAQAARFDQRSPGHQARAAQQNLPPRHPRPAKCEGGRKSGRWDSNPRRPAWEAGILPLNYSRLPDRNFSFACMILQAILRLKQLRAPQVMQMQNACYLLLLVHHHEARNLHLFHLRQRHRRQLIRRNRLRTARHNLPCR